MRQSIAKQMIFLAFYLAELYISYGRKGLRSSKHVVFHIRLHLSSAYYVLIIRTYLN
jgi:hypothetical protein